MRFLVFLLFIVVTGPIFAKDSEVTLLNRLPDKIGGFVAGDVEAYDDKRYGASLGYSQENEKSKTILTVILYDGGVGEIGEGLSSAYTNLAFDAAIKDIHLFESEGLYRNVTEVKRTTLTLSGTDALFVSLSYEVDVSGYGDYERVNSFLVVTGIKGYILKIRITGNGIESNGGSAIAVSDEIIKFIDG